VAWGEGNSAEQAEFKRIYGMMGTVGGGGTVVVNILTSNLKPLKNIHVMVAQKPGVLLQNLQSVIADLSLSPGEPLIKPRRHFLAKNATPDDLALHLTARRLEEEERLVPGQFPGETWIVYKASELPKIVGNTEPKVGAEWEIPPALAQRLLVHVYAQDISSDHPEANQILVHRFNARIISVENGVVRARLDAHLLMNRIHVALPAYSKRIDATLAGYLDFEVEGRRILAFKLATTSATSDGQDFHLGVTSQPKIYVEPMVK
jgi:hypothetical protein